jgi:hypothetical protein
MMVGGVAATHEAINDTERSEAHQQLRGHGREAARVFAFFKRRPSPVRSAANWAQYLHYCHLVSHPLDNRLFVRVVIWRFDQEVPHAPHACGGGRSAVAIFYKGVGVGTYLHGKNLNATGISAALPGQTNDLANLVRHIAQGSALSPFISFTKSWDVAEDYARNASLSRPNSTNPAYVWEI